MVPADKISVTFAVNIINDDISECNETFSLMLTNSIPTPPCGVVIGRNDTSEVMIRDDDGRKVLVIMLCYIDQQEQCCHLTSQIILLKRTLLHYQLV